MFLSQISSHTFFAKDLTSTSVVLDLGANLGDFSSAIVKQYGCRCCAIEANPALCQKIKPNPRIEVHNLAVAGRSGPITLYLSASCDASSILTGGRRTVGKTEVQAVSLDELFRLAGIDQVDLIKMDIEGAEIEVLESCSDELLSKVPQLTIEFHDFCGLTPRPAVERSVRRLRSLGFFPIKIWRGAYGDTLFINRKLSSVTFIECLLARYVTRNWWGLKRVVSREILHKANV